MAENILVSPGIAISEADQSAIAARPLVAGAAIIGPTVKGPINVPTKVTSYRQYVQKFGDTFIPSGSNETQEFLTSLAAKSYFEQGGESLLVTRVAKKEAFTPAHATAIIASGSATAPFELETLSVGASLNNVPTSQTASWTSDNPAGVEVSGSLVSGSANSFRFVISNVDPEQGTFSLTVRRGDDSDVDQVILENYNNLSLDPYSSNYIAKVIGDQVTSAVQYGEDWVVESRGNYVNNSAYIRVKNVNNLPGYVRPDGTFNPAYTASLPVAQEGGFLGASGLVGACYQMSGSTAVVDESGSALYFENLKATEGVHDFNQSVKAEDYATAISLMANSDEYEINILSAPGLLDAAQVSNLKSVAEERGDCIAVIDLVPFNATLAEVKAGATAQNSSYAATYWPWLQMYSSMGKLVWCPASTVVPGIYAYNDVQAAPWYAPAGMIRGGVQGVTQTERKLTKSMRDELYLKNVNPIATLPGAGIVTYGQKTLQKKASALDRVNVRRLLIAVKKRIKDIASQLLFEQNTPALQNSFAAQVNAYLASIVQRNGLTNFTVDLSGNTPDAIDRNEFHCTIALQPTRAIEFVYIDFVVTATGVEFNS